MEPIWINKLDVAERQIVEAITLFYESRDPVVIHTIIASAHQILHDIGSESGITGAIKNPEGMTRKEFREHVKSVNEPYNYFKHADKDPDSKINVAPINEFTMDFILDAVIMLQNIKRDLPLKAKLFWGWFVCSFPEQFENMADNDFIKETRALGLHEWSFESIRQFFVFGEIIE